MHSFSYSAGCGAASGEQAVDMSMNEVHTAPIPLSTHSRSNRGRSSINTNSARDGAKMSVCGKTMRRILRQSSAA